MEKEEKSLRERLDDYIEAHPLLCRIYCYVVYEKPNTLLFIFIIGIAILTIVLLLLIYYGIIL